MTYYIFFILSCLILLLVNNAISKKLLYPPTIFTFTWTAIILVHLLLSIFSIYKPYVIGLKTLVYILTVLTIFSIGGLLSKALYKKPMNGKGFNFTLKESWINIVLIMNIISLIAFLNKIKQITGSYFDMLMFRYYTSVLRIDIGLVKYSITFTIFSSVLILSYLFSKKMKTTSLVIKTIIILLCGFSIVILSASRGSVFFLIISLLGVYSSFYKLKTKLILKIVGITISLFIVMAVLMKKSMPNEHTSDKNYTFTTRIEYFIYSYSALPVSAFNQFFNEPYEKMNGDLLLRFPKAVLYKAKIIKTPPVNLVEEYVEVPDRVNVYTAFYKFIKDLGVVYSLIMFFLIGIIHTYAYFKSNHSVSFLLLYSFLLFPLIMSFFEENYIAILSTWLQLFFFILFAKYIMVKNE